VVYPWHCDHMGHMNVMWYVGKFDEATWIFFARILAGDVLVAVTTFTGVHLDTQLRKGVTLPPEIRRRVEQHLGT
jgi:acyl-CoA thioesterase FadM